MFGTRFDLVAPDLFVPKEGSCFGLPHKQINENRKKIQMRKYENKKDWDELPKYRRFARENNIKLIPFKHYEEFAPKSKIQDHAIHAVAAGQQVNRAAGRPQDEHGC